MKETEKKEKADDKDVFGCSHQEALERASELQF